MKRLFIFCCLVLLVESCKTPERKHDKSPYEELCQNFLLDVYDKKYEKVLDNMDDAFKRVAKDINLDSSFTPLTDQMRKSYEAPIKLTLISSEKTVYENFFAIFLIVKIESEHKFGYFFLC